MKIVTKRRNDMSACQEIVDRLISVESGLQLIPWFEKSDQREPVTR